MAVQVVDLGAIPERVREKIAFGPGCWNWIAGKGDQGYGRVRGFTGKNVRSHRLVFEAIVGPIPGGLDLDHLCRNRACCNPDHLEPVTRRENIMRSPIAIASMYASRTHCNQGHERTPENIHVKPDGARICAICSRAYGIARRAAARASIR